MLTVPSIEGLKPAPFYHAVAQGPAGVEAWWVEAEDDTRLRMAVWPRGQKGTIMMFPGRTEYIEKYGRVAADMAAVGYGMVSFDWRGQGLADRPPHNPGMGHVESFDEYRQDVAAFLTAMDMMNLPKPWFLIGHSMGGCIGLRALYDGYPVAAAAFTGPMWGLQISPFLKTILPFVMISFRSFGLAKSFAPSTGPWTPMPFEGNPLTTDQNQFDYMTRQMDAHPELALGGPSYTWVKQALLETSALMDMNPPDLPVVTIVGSRERIVSIEAAKERMATWPNGTYIGVDGAEHEVLLEDSEKRGQALSAIFSLFDAQLAA